jgi:hypothetical protein
MAQVQEIFDMAIHMMDEQNESNGITGTVDTQEYRFRTISILNSVIPMLQVYSSDYDRAGFGRPEPYILMADDYTDPDFTQEIELDNLLSYSLLPYYLAAQLLSGENEDLASWFMTRYREAFNDIKNKILAEFESINTPYGLF